MSARTRQLASRRGAHRTRRGPLGVLGLLLAWLLLAAVVLGVLTVLAQRVAGPLLDVAGSVL